MAINSYFNNFNQSGEQSLINSLVIESIRIYGINVYYILRTHRDLDDVLNEDDLSEFSTNRVIEMYIKNVDSFEGEGDFLSKFGLEVRDSMTLTLAQTVFKNVIGTPLSLPRPREGDVLYFPLNKKMFEIRHVEHEAIFYQLGALQTYDLKCELFEFSNEKFNTGIPEIDNLWANRRISANTTQTQLETIDGLADNFEIQTSANSVIDWSETSPFGEF